MKLTFKSVTAIAFMCLVGTKAISTDQENLLVDSPEYDRFMCVLPDLAVHAISPYLTLEECNNFILTIRSTFDGKIVGEKLDKAKDGYEDTYYFQQQFLLFQDIKKRYSFIDWRAEDEKSQGILEGRTDKEKIRNLSRLGGLYGLIYNYVRDCNADFLEFPRVDGRKRLDTRNLFSTFSQEIDSEGLNPSQKISNAMRKIVAIDINPSIHCLEYGVQKYNAYFVVNQKEAFLEQKTVCRFLLLGEKEPKIYREAHTKSTQESNNELSKLIRESQGFINEADTLNPYFHLFAKKWRTALIERKINFLKKEGLFVQKEDHKLYIQSLESIWKDEATAEDFNDVPAMKGRAYAGMYRYQFENKIDSNGNLKEFLLDEHEKECFKIIQLLNVRLPMPADFTISKHHFAIFKHHFFISKHIKWARKELVKIDLHREELVKIDFHKGFIEFFMKVMDKK